MQEVRYVCKGSCGGIVTEEEYFSGKDSCGMETCELFGEPLEKRQYCSECGVIFNEGEEHECSAGEF